MVAVNIKTDGYDIRIDRKTKWGNPFVINDKQSRKEVIAKYKIYLWNQIKQNDISLEELANLHNKKLGCWCAPEECHGDVLTAAAQWAYGELQKANKV